MSLIRSSLLVGLGSVAARVLDARDGERRGAYAERGRLGDVMELLLTETRGPADGPRPAAPELRRYRARAGDEAVGSNRRPRPVYEPVVEVFRDLGADRVQERVRARDASSRVAATISCRSGTAATSR